jgi:hypothetical protein
MAQKQESISPVNGQCPEGYILVGGGEGEEGARCVKNPFQVIKNKETGKLEYDKDAINALSRYVKSYISGLPKDKVKDEGVLYENIFSQLISGSGGSTSDPLTKAYLDNNKEGIENAIKNANTFYTNPPYNSIINNIGSREINYGPAEDEQRLLIQRRLDEGYITPSEAKTELDSKVNKLLEHKKEVLGNIPEEFRWGNEPQSTITETSQVSPLNKLVGTSGGTWNTNINIPKQSEQLIDNRLMIGGAGGGSAMDSYTPSIIKKQSESNTIQEGLGTQGFPQQALAIQEEAPSVSGGVSGNRQNEMMAIADNVESGVYTDPNVIKAQNVAAQTVTNQQGVNSATVTQPDIQAVQQPKQKMSVLGRLKSLLGFGEENQNDISSFQDAGLTQDATTGTQTVDVISQNQTLPEDVVKPNQTTGTQKRGTGNPPPQYATQGIVSDGGSPFVNVLNNQVVTTLNDKGQQSKSLQDLIEIGGSGFDDEVYARKLRRQAAMPELKNEDYYPNEPFTESRTAWGDPIYSGAGALFPMAAYDAQRNARAQAELDEAKRDIIQLKIPEIKTGAYIQRFRGDYANEILGAVDEAVKQAGGNRQRAMRNLKQSGKLAEIENKYNGIAKSIDQTADRAKDFLKNAQEKSTTMYFSPEGVRAATNFMNGAGAYADGLISGEDLNKLEQQFITAEKWEKFKQENMGKLKPTDYIPTPEQLKNITPEDREAFKAVQLDLGGKAPDFNTWLYTQKYTEAALPQVMEGIVQPFFDQEKTAAEQLVLPGEKLEDAKLRIARGIAALFGRQYSQGTATQTPKANTRINIDNSQPTKKTFYQSIDEKKGEIMSEAMKAKPTNVAQAKQVAEQIYGGGTADDFFFGVRAFDWPSINMSIASMPYSELYEPQIPKEKVYFHKVNKKNAGIPETNTTAKNLKVHKAKLYVLRNGLLLSNLIIIKLAYLYY